MLNEDRKHFVTASQAWRVMAGYELELMGLTMTLPDNSYLTEWMEVNCQEKPLVGDIKKAGFESSGKEINSIWNFLKATTPVFSEGMESVAQEIAMADFIIKRDEGYQSDDMERGNIQESEAIKGLEIITGIIFENTGDNQSFLSDGDLGVTPDGIEYDGFNIESCAEVKNPKDTTHMRYLVNLKNQATLLENEPKYYWQCQAGIAVSKAKKYHFMSLHNQFITELQRVYVEVLPEPEHINLLQIRAQRVIKRSHEIKDQLIKEFGL